MSLESYLNMRDQAQFAQNLSEFMGVFSEAHPEAPFIGVHDSLVFESKEDFETFQKEYTSWTKAQSSRN